MKVCRCAWLFSTFQICLVALVFLSFMFLFVQQVWTASIDGQKIRFAVTSCLSSLPAVFCIEIFIHPTQFLSEFRSSPGLSCWLLFRGSVVAYTEVCNYIRCCSWGNGMIKIDKSFHLLTTGWIFSVSQLVWNCQLV
jgi:hypothetical protein